MAERPRLLIGGRDRAPGDRSPLEPAVGRPRELDPAKLTPERLLAEFVELLDQLKTLQQLAAQMGFGLPDCANATRCRSPDEDESPR